jgi:hypothetical protein
VERRIARSTKIEAATERMLLDGADDPDRLTELGRLGAQLVLQRAVEEEVEAFLGRARYERTPDARGSRNGHRPKRVQTAEGEITIAMPQVRDSLIGSVSSVIPDVRGMVRTRPLEALVIGAYVRGIQRPRHRVPRRRGRPGDHQQEHRLAHLPRAARPRPGLPRPLPRRGPPAGALL